MIERSKRRRRLVGGAALIGLWMAHCHIAEHIESGMLLSFRVDDPATTTVDNPGSRAEMH